MSGNQHGPVNPIIIASRYDMHAVAIDWMLKKKGVRPHYLDFSEFPDQTRISLKLEADSSRLVLSDGVVVDLTKPRTVWFRREYSAQLSKSMHPADVAMASAETVSFRKCVLSALNTSLNIWINPPSVRYVVATKFAQLAAAREFGFRVPRTVMTNDAKCVQELFFSNKGLVHKSFTPHAWVGQDIVCDAKTTVVLEEDLQRTVEIAGCPGIYQEKISKQSEIRVTCIGSQVFAAEIHSQDDGETIDWRYDGKGHQAPTRKILLPSEMEQRLLGLLRRLGMVYGCVDLIRTQENEFVFLEINEAGQYLWIEEATGMQISNALANKIADPDGRLELPDAHFHEFRLSGAFARTYEYLKGRPMPQEVRNFISPE